MTRRIIVWSIAVAGLLLATENINAQSRTVRSVNADRREVVEQPKTDRNTPIRRDPRNVTPSPEKRAPQAPRDEFRLTRPDDRPRNEIRMLSNESITVFEALTWDSERNRMARLMLIDGVGMTVDQIIRMARAFDMDSGRLEFLEKAYPYCMDRWNFYRTAATMKYTSSRDKLITFALEAGIETLDRFYEVTVSKQELKDIVRILNGENLDSRRLKMAKLIIAGNCMTARQIAQMADTFDFDSGRSDFLLFAYRYCYDRENYGTAVNTLTFSSSRRALNEELIRMR